MIIDGGSQFVTLEAGASFGSVLQSIVIPPSIKVLPEGCFEHCVILSNLPFASHSRLKIIPRATFRASEVQVIRIRGLVEVIDAICLERCVRL
jgi:hypothetical protein